MVSLLVLRAELIAIARAMPRALSALLLCACATTTPVQVADRAPRTATLYLIAGGWHTEVALERAAARALPPELAAAFRDARYLVFGWGERDYYMAANPGLGDALRALTPGPAAMLVIPLAVPPADAFGAGNVLALPVTEAGLARVTAYLADSIAEEQGRLVALGDGPEPGSEFYQATGRYDLAHTCNTWTAAALAAAGLPIDPSDVVFASQVMRAARPLAAN